MTRTQRRIGCDEAKSKKWRRKRLKGTERKRANDKEDDEEEDGKEEGESESEEMEGMDDRNNN
jgi:hypothetical protein